MKKVMIYAGLLAGFCGLTSGTTARAIAHNQLEYLPDSTEYVRTNRTMDVGLSRKTHGRYHRCLVSKGTLLQVDGVGGNDHQDQNGHWEVLAAFTTGAVHYDRLKRLRFTHKTCTIPFTKANFTAVKLDTPLRTQLLQAGSGFKAGHHRKFTTPAAFYLTLDNYLQYYSPKMMKHARNGALAQLSGRNLLKPTQAVKIDRVRVNGRTTTLDYRQAVRGLPNRRLGDHHYQLTITHLKGQHINDFFPQNGTFGASASWTTYRVNQQAYFSGQATTGIN